MSEARIDTEANRAAAADSDGNGSEIAKRLTTVSQDFLSATAQFEGLSNEEYNRSFETAILQTGELDLVDHQTFANLNIVANRAHDNDTFDIENYGGDVYVAAVEAHTKALKASNEFSDRQKVAINGLSREDMAGVLDTIATEVHAQKRQATSAQERFDVSKELQRLDDYILDFTDYKHNAFPSADDLTSANKYFDLNVSYGPGKDSSYEATKQEVATQIERDVVYAKYADRIAQKAVERIPSQE